MIVSVTIDQTQEPTAAADVAVETSEYLTKKEYKLFGQNVKQILSILNFSKRNKKWLEQILIKSPVTRIIEIDGSW